MSIEFLAIVALSVLVTILFLLVYLKDRDTAKKLKLYEKIIEDLNRESHSIRKRIEKKSSSDEFDYDSLKAWVSSEIEKQVKMSLTPLAESIEKIESVMLDFQNEQIKRIDSLEESKKRINFAPPNMVDSNEKLIISQYKEGKSEAMIAKDLRIGVGEVELILKLANLK